MVVVANPRTHLHSEVQLQESTCNGVRTLGCTERREEVATHLMGMMGKQVVGKTFLLHGRWRFFGLVISGHRQVNDARFQRPGLPRDAFPDAAAGRHNGSGEAVRRVFVSAFRLLLDLFIDRRVNGWKRGQ